MKSKRVADTIHNKAGEALLISEKIYITLTQGNMLMTRNITGGHC